MTFLGIFRRAPDCRFIRPVIFRSVSEKPKVKRRRRCFCRHCPHSDDIIMLYLKYNGGTENEGNDHPGNGR